MKNYIITRDKFLSIKERNRLLRCCKKEATVDYSAERSTWISRYMLIHLYQTRQEARGSVFEYIEVFYNRVRRHSSLDYCSPVEFERRARVA